MSEINSDEEEPIGCCSCGEAFLLSEEGYAEKDGDLKLCGVCWDALGRPEIIDTSKKKYVEFIKQT